jgi:prepilin-type N-terminal cleavage/methylation domain-containing protein
MTYRSGFTLIELLIVIAIIAVLAVVVVLTLNPSQLILQSRDSGRLSDMANLSAGLGYYVTDASINGTVSLGSSSVVYVSLPDPTATSTAGDHCEGLSLVALPSSYSYHCAASSTFRNMNGQGWVPVDFTGITQGVPFGSLPTDPVNTSSSRDYYTYTTDGTHYEVTAVMESAKYQLGGSNDVISGDGGTLASVYEKGSKIGLEPLDYGDSSLVGLWTFDEGGNNVAYDYSGDNATGSLSSPPPTWATGRIGSGALSFNGSNNYVNVSNAPSLNFVNTITVSMWYYEISNSGYQYLIEENDPSGFGFRGSSGNMRLDSGGSNYCIQSAYPVSLNSWELLTAVAVPSGASTNWSIYKNGTLQSTSTCSNMNTSGASLVIGKYPAGLYFWNGLIDDVRVYNRALSAAQIAALYAGGK